jgi:hypothetical protein
MGNAIRARVLNSYFCAYTAMTHVHVLKLDMRRTMSQRASHRRQKVPSHITGQKVTVVLIEFTAHTKKRTHPNAASRKLINKLNMNFPSSAALVDHRKFVPRRLFSSRDFFIIFTHLELKKCCGP